VTRIIYRPNSVLLPADITREPSRPPELRDAEFEAKYDYTTFLYDYFMSDDRMILIGPPLLNVEDRINWRESLSGGILDKYSIGKLDKLLRVAVERWHAPNIDFANLQITVPVRENAAQNNIFENERVLMTLSKDNEIEWIRDWVLFHNKIHGATALLLYDNSSTTYSPEGLLDALSDLPLSSIVIVAWPYRYGPGKAPFDSNYCQYGVLEHSRLYFLERCRSMLNCDIDELVVGQTDDDSVFVATETGGGYTQFRGRWILPLGRSGRDATSKPIAERRHRDFVFYVNGERSQARETKYCIVPSCLKRWMQCAVHSVIDGWNHYLPAFRAQPHFDRFYYGHFRAINTNWKWKRDQLTELDRTDVVSDDRLVALFAKVDNTDEGPSMPSPGTASIVNAAVQDDSLDPALASYLRRPPPHCLEIGAGTNAKPGWLSSDLDAHQRPGGAPVIILDATRPFAIPKESFDFIYCEHMIEHIKYDDALFMLQECNRIMKPHGVIRIATPCIEFLFRVVSAVPGSVEEAYREWSVRKFVPEAAEVTNAFFLNNFMRSWNHSFIFDRPTLALALRLANFEQIKDCEIEASDHEHLQNLENEGRLPPGFLRLESMILEATKGKSAPVGEKPRKNLALHKPAIQSSLSRWSLEATIEAEAARAVSGVRTGSYNCHTDLEDGPWWRVDLQSPCVIDEVHIYNRIEDPAIMARTNRFEIKLSDDDKNWNTVFRKNDDRPVHGRTKRLPFIWKSDKRTVGRFVCIQLIGRQYLHLEQVEIFGQELKGGGAVGSLVAASRQPAAGEG